jgi:hypothetical protein
MATNPVKNGQPKTGVAAQSALAANVPVSPVPEGGAPQNLPSAPVAPAVKAAKQKKELTPAQLELKKKFDEARKEFNASIGKVAKAKTATSTSTQGFTGTEMVTVSAPGATGFTTERDKAIAAKIGGGMALNELLKLDDVDGFSWVRRRLARGSIKFDGLTLQDAFKVAKSVPTEQRSALLAPAAPAPSPEAAKA